MCYRYRYLSLSIYIYIYMLVYIYIYTHIITSYTLLHRYNSVRFRIGCVKITNSRHGQYDYRYYIMILCSIISLLSLYYSVY